MLRALTDPDQRYVGPLPRGDASDVFDVDLACDDLVAQANDNRGDERQPILALVGDQDTEMFGPVRERLHEPIVIRST